MHTALIRDYSLGSYSFDIVKRMLGVLITHGRSMKKTNLASKSGLNYNVCSKYVLMLNCLGWVEVNPDVSITELGKSIFANLNHFSEVLISNGHDFWPSNLGEKNMIYSGSSSGVLSTSLTSSCPTIQTKSLTLQSSIIDERTISENKQKKDNTKKKSVMIVDDEEDIAIAYKHFLTSVGYDVRAFVDSRSALREYISNPLLYDLLVLDIRMQGINGLQLYQSVKAINADCRAIFITCLDTAKEVLSLMPGTKPEHIMQKPVNRERFVAAVQAALPLK